MLPTSVQVVQKNTTSSSQPPFISLTKDEINAFFDDLDADKDGYVTFEELEAKLEEVHHVLAPEPQRHHLHHPQRRGILTAAHLKHQKKDGDIESNSASSNNSEQDGLHEFLCSLLPKCGKKLDREQFITQVSLWNVPSRDQTSLEDEDLKDSEYTHSLPLARKIRAHWSVEGPKIIFTACIAGVILALALWQMIKYIKNERARATFGWGVIVAKVSAGAIYPALSLTILSMSRWFSTWMRRFHHISRFIDWDRSQAFHIWMACIGLGFATLHAIGHLTGTFIYGSRSSHSDDVAVWIGPEHVPQRYSGYLATLPGWSGVSALGLYWIMTTLSIPKVRQMSYEAFQMGHLLMFPFIGLLCAHGTMRILQDPMLGYWLAFPTLLVIFERVHRLIWCAQRTTARVKILDDDTVMITCKKQGGKAWKYEVGQYIFLQVPKISIFQWHPFTISSCQGELLQVHIKTDGNWTGKLRLFSPSEDIRVGVDGPFGAPTQRFYSFDKSLIIGAGVGITPFAAILNDIEQKFSGGMEDPWNPRSGRSSRRPSLGNITRRARSRVSVLNRGNTRETTTHKRDYARTESPAPIPAAEERETSDNDGKQEASSAEEVGTTLKFETKRAVDDMPERRVDFHWMVRDKNYLLWFSSLLNRVHDLNMAQRMSPTASIEINLTPHITVRRRNISTHVFRYLLDRYRTPTSPHSALTGLKMTSSFGRPDLEGILRDFHADMLAQGWSRGKVGVFFCGNPNIGRLLADACAELTAQARADGSKIRYVFMMEVFG